MAARRKMSVREIADRLGVTPAYVRRIITAAKIGEFDCHWVNSRDSLTVSETGLHGKLPSETLNGRFVRVHDVDEAIAFYTNARLRCGHASSSGFGSLTRGNLRLLLNPAQVVPDGWNSILAEESMISMRSTPH
jgi:hypothetical protein